jgi:hypothetical protein
MKQTGAAFFITLLLIALWVYTASSKLLDIERFTNTLRQHRLIGRGADVVAWTVPLTELAIVLLLFYDRARKYGLRASLYLLVLFALYLGYMLLFEPHLPCSCGGVVGRMSWRMHLLFNLCFIVLTLIALRGSTYKKDSCMNRGSRKPV